MEMYKILLLTVAVIAPVTSQNATDEPIFTIPQPEIIPNPAHKVLYSTEKVSLQCSVSESIPDLQYEWFKDSSPLNSPTDKSTITVNAGGTYECRAKKRSSVSDKSNPYSFTLQAIPTPKLTLEPKWTEIYPSEKVTLSCEIQGSSDTWTYRWFKNNEDLGETNPTLTITAKSSSDSGEYACKGKINGRSVITQQSNVFQLNVRDPLPKPRLTQTPDFQVIYTGEKLTFNCKSEVQSSGWEYLFFRNSNQIKTDTSANSFSVTSAQVQDSGKYWCQTKRITLTSGQSDERTVTVKDPPSVKVVSDWTDAFPGETVTLQCVIQDTSEKWTYTWFKDRNIVSSGPDTQINGNTLSISVKPGQSGTYTYVCQAELEGRSVKTKESSSHSFKVHESMPTITLKQDPEYPAIYTEEQVRFTCSITEQTSPSWTYQWKKDNTEVSSGGQTYTISSATMLHKGSYTCHISRNGVPFSSEPKKLTIIEPPQPQLSKEPQWDLFYPTEKVTLTCSINENPNDWEYEWYKNEIKLSKDNDISISEKTLSINSAKSSHSGSYTCKAKHLQRSPVTTKKSEALQLHISGSMPTISLKQDPEYPAIYTGEQVRLTCSITEQTSTQWTYQWKKDNTEVSSGGQTYTISSATMLHKGSYTCHISRNGVPFSSEPKQLTIIEPPQPQLSKEPQWDLFYPTEKVTLTCSINENPNDWEYEWYKNEIKLSKDNDISISEKTLSINSAKSSHSGSYTCKAKHLQRSPVTTKEAEALQLHISGSMPTISLKQDPEYPAIYTGEQVRFTCSITEQTSPPWTYQWKKDNTEVSSGSQTYTISSATMLHKGSYTCHISRNGVPFSSEPKNLTIIEPPQPQLSKEPQWDLFYPTEEVTLTCSINENPNDWEYEWYKNEMKLSKDNDISLSGKTLSINSAKSSHSGSYTCKAKHLQRSPVTTKEAEALQLHISDSTPEPDIRQDPSFEFFYTDEQVRLTCNMPGAAWEYHWYKDSETTELSTANKNYIINSASLHDTGEYYCKAKRRDFSINSGKMKVQVKEPPQPQLSKEPQWDLFYPIEKVILTCSINENPNDWEYEWYNNKIKLSKDNDISISGKTLSINFAKSSHSGNYKCKAKHLRRSPVTTKESEALHLNISVSTPKPVIQPEPSFEFFYTDERVQLTCDMPGAAWEYYWYKDSKTTKLSTVDKNYIINSASAHDAGDFYCEAKRRDFLIQSEGKKVQVKALSAASLNLVTELSDIIAGNILTLNCKVLDDKTWNYTWFENNQELNESSSTLKVKSTEETIKNEFKCRGKRTERPLYSYWSDPFMANNILFKRKILLAISGCFVCCIVILIIGCIVLKITRKPEKKEPVRDNLFISLADSKNQTTSPLMEYMESKPLEKESEEKEELQLDSISVTHVDGVIKGEDSPSAETNGLTSFKAS
ncbi:Fc receptor-like protein 5 isoform X1 [Paramisgurnus dabryanus]|uniref:Fc receptor-like protein 5 isoform X1 n=1 Tax=Paramisgurnus dabryanus TaxID=90735 RepID=UPI0031F44E54